MLHLQFRLATPPSLLPSGTIAMPPSLERNTFEVHEWKFRTYKGSILSCRENDELCSRLATCLSPTAEGEDLVHGEECVQCGGGVKIGDAILQLPELLFGNNKLEIEVPGSACGKQGGGLV